ncbi:centromere protein L-like, partial [Argonauta hians]
IFNSRREFLLFCQRGRTSTRMSLPPQFSSKTPSRRKLPETNADIDPPDIPVLKNVCQLYKSCPILNFETTPSKLKKYATSLKNYCQDPSKVYLVPVTSCDITLLEGFKVSEADTEAVQVRLYTKKGSQQKLILLALLCCVNFPPQFAAVERPSNFYPVIVIRGPKWLKSWLIQWFENDFHARISLLQFSSIDLCWMLSLWTSRVDDGAQPTYLVYEVPEEIRGLREIKISIESKDLKYIWDKIHPDPDDSEVTIDQVNEFITQIELFYYQTLKIKLTSLRLVKIRNPLASISVNGVFQLCSSEHLLGILGLFCHMSLEQMSFVWREISCI